MRLMKHLECGWQIEVDESRIVVDWIVSHPPVRPEPDLAGFRNSNPDAQNTEPDLGILVFRSQNNMPDETKDVNNAAICC